MKSKNNLIKALKENPYIKEFLSLEEKLNTNEKLKNEILELQKLQQKMINLKNIDKINAYKATEKTYWTKRNKLESNPFIKNYLTLQEEINNLLQTIKDILEDALIV